MLSRNFCQKLQFSTLLVCGKPRNSLPCKVFPSNQFIARFFSKTSIWRNFCGKTMVVKFPFRPFAIQKLIGQKIVNQILRKQRSYHHFPDIFEATHSSTQSNSSQNCFYNLKRNFKIKEYFETENNWETICLFVFIYVSMGKWIVLIFFMLTDVFLEKDLQKSKTKSYSIGRLMHG